MTWEQKRREWVAKLWAMSTDTKDRLLRWKIAELIAAPVESPDDKRLFMEWAVAHPGQVIGMPLEYLVARLRARSQARTQPATVTPAPARPRLYDTPVEPPKPPKPMAPVDERRRNARHEARHAVVALAYGLPVHSVRVYRAGGGVCQLLPCDCPLEADLDYTCAGPTANDDPNHWGTLAKLKESDHALAIGLLKKLQLRDLTRGWRFAHDEMAYRQFMVGEAVRRINAIADANRDTENNLADALFRRSEWNGRVTYDDLRTGAFPVRRASCNGS